MYRSTETLENPALVIERHENCFRFVVLCKETVTFQDTPVTSIWDIAEASNLVDLHTWFDANYPDLVNLWAPALAECLNPTPIHIPTRLELARAAYEAAAVALREALNELTAAEAEEAA